ncbi:pentatricopeptide repeat-containing protein [Tanacetum coccineum]
MPDTNTALYNSIFKGFIANEMYIDAMLFFGHMVNSNVRGDYFTMPMVLKACAKVSGLRDGGKVFGEIEYRNAVTWTSMIRGYVLSGEVGFARKLFDLAPERDVVMWNTMVSGYMDCGDMGGAKKLRRALELGNWVHLYAANNGYKKNAYVGNSLIDMYAKCGLITSAIEVFKEMNKKDLISWNTIINGLAMHDHGSDALRIFHEMKSAKQKPDGITFICIICACSRMGLVKDEFTYFNSMLDEYSIEPQIEHYGCMVDLLSRAGLIEEAVECVNKMPLKPDNVIWTNLLGSSKVYKNVSVAELCLQRLIELEPENPSNYVMQSNIYGDAKRWNDLARSKVAIRNTGAKKLPGCTLIEVDDGVVEFSAFDERHPKTEDIYSALRSLIKVSKAFGYVHELIDYEIQT